MLSSINNRDMYLGCVGANIFLSAGMAFMMSMKRIKNTKVNANKAKDPFNNLPDEDEMFGIEQALAAEWSSPISILQIALMLKFGNSDSTLSKAAAGAAITATVTRYLFHLRSFNCCPKALIAPFMVTCYLAVFTSCGLLVAPSS